LKFVYLRIDITTSSSVFQQPGKLFTLFKDDHILNILNLMKLISRVINKRRSEHVGDNDLEEKGTAERRIKKL
jgi:hypothetical protein